jgi:sigma-54-interacting transcriptional regulator
MGGVSVEYPSRLCSGVNPDTAPHSSRPFSETDAVPLSAASDLKVARITRTNLLLVGPERLVSSALNLVASGARREAAIQCQGGQLQLPSSPSQPSTIVVRDVDALTSVEQRRLLEWLDAANSRTQVISAASVPLLPLVEASRFDENLYYRLNTIYIDLAE